jgi:AraC family transcriptional regulator
MKEATRAAYEESILRVQMHMQKALDDPFDANEIASVSGFSRFHLSRLFSAMTGESLLEYRRRLLLERAAHSLLYKARSVTELAFEAGYETPETFTRAFSKLYGVPPGEYRRKLRAAMKHRLETIQVRSKLFTLSLSIDEGGRKNMEVKIEKHDSLKVAFIRHTGPYDTCGDAWNKLCGAPEVASRLGPNTLALSLCYDDPDVTESDKIRMDACVTVDDGFAPGNGIEVQTIPGGEFAVVVYKGAYSGLHDAYRAIYGEWLPKSGREFGGSYSMEIYRTDPEKTPPEESITEIRIPLL